MVLVDGARHQLDLIRAEAERRTVRIHIVIDLIHVLEYLWKAAWCPHATDDPAAEDWVATHALALLAGHLDHVVATLDAQATAAGLTPDHRNGVDTCIRYRTGHAEFLHYDHALEHGRPIATGVIEGACRHLIGDRLDITGARWGLPGAEAILKLRALISCETSRPTGAITSTANTNASIKPLTRTNTPTPPDRPAHCGRATPYGYSHRDAVVGARC
ncbi:hypothetical protein AB0M95_14980 [Sphaerisporangium sp. NPDC051017]|uniref:hypothetical protein n=1 Tax=Sphaerisporangium sp. NPDC051017 TaxID=3154636 RepID=UPI003449ECF6